MSKADNQKNSAMAARMKELGIRRKSGSCPMSCGLQVPVGGAGLMQHLMVCTGKRRR